MEAAFDIKDIGSNGMISGPTPNPMGFGMATEMPVPAPVAPQEPVGVGAVPVGVGLTPPSGMSPDSIAPLNTNPSANYQQIYPIDTCGTGTGLDVQGILTAMRGLWNGGAGSSGFGPINNFLHFWYMPTATTNCVSPGMGGVALMRYRGGVSESIELAYQFLATTTIEQPQTPTSVIASTSAPAPTLAAPVTSTDQGQYTWSQYAWIYLAANPGDIPSQPPPGSTTGIGRWVNTTGLQFDFYPGPGNIQPILDPSGNTWWINSSSHAASNATDTAGGASWNPPLPGTVAAVTPPPALAGSTGRWVYAHPSYYVWLSGTAALTTGEEVALFLLLAGVVGGIAYLIWD